MLFRSGEKKLELDRRKIEQRITELKKELEEIGQERQTQRKRRMQSRTPQVGLVGYTNAGKSTIMNRMVEAYGEIETKKVLEKDMLFATLETADITLEDSFSAYQEGISLIKYCNQIVTDVEQKVMILEENGHEHEF